MWAYKIVSFNANVQEAYDVFCFQKEGGKPSMFEAARHVQSPFGDSGRVFIIITKISYF